MSNNQATHPLTTWPSKALESRAGVTTLEQSATPGHNLKRLQTSGGWAGCSPCGGGPPTPHPPSDIGTIHSVSTSRSTIHVAHYKQQNRCSSTTQRQRTHNTERQQVLPRQHTVGPAVAQERRSTAADRELGGEQFSRAAIANSRQLFCSGFKVAQSCRKFPSARGRRCCGQNWLDKEEVRRKLETFKRGGLRLWSGADLVFYRSLTEACAFSLVGHQPPHRVVLKGEFGASVNSSR